MLIEFIKKDNFYDYLEYELLGNKTSKSIIYNFIPVKILGEYYILTCLKNLEGYLLDYKENINVKLYINDTVQFLKLNSIISFTEKNYNSSLKYDCYIDSITNLILIRFKYDDFNYIEIDNYLNPETDILKNQEDILLTYYWMTNQLKNFKITKKKN